MGQKASKLREATGGDSHLSSTSRLPWIVALWWNEATAYYDYCHGYFTWSVGQRVTPGSAELYSKNVGEFRPKWSFFVPLGLRIYANCRIIPWAYFLYRTVFLFDNPEQNYAWHWSRTISPTLLPKADCILCLEPCQINGMPCGASACCLISYVIYFGRLSFKDECLFQGSFFWSDLRLWAVERVASWTCQPLQS